MAKDRAFPKSHFALSAVKAEHLAFAFHVAQGTATQRMKSDDPTAKEVTVENNGELTSYSFTDTPSTRVMFAMIKELKSLYPGDDKASFQSCTAIIHRVNAVFEMLKLDEIGFHVTKDQNGDYFLGEEIVNLCACAPLSRHKAQFRKKEFINLLSSTRYPSQPSELRFHLPNELVNEERLAKIKEQAVR